MRSIPYVSSPLIILVLLSRKNLKGNSILQQFCKNGYDSYAEFYDTWHDRWPENSKMHCVEKLAEIAAGEAALELGIGTGRLGLPLAQKGVPVYGIDNSEPMLNKLRAKPGSENLSVVCGDFSGIPIEGVFGLIYTVLSFGYLLTQQEQVRCFVNARQKIKPGGAFVIQTAVPRPNIFNGSNQVDDIFDIPSEDGAELDAVMLLCSKTDTVRQLIDQRVIVLGEAAPKIYTHQRRYVWPSELDLMAQIAGFTLDARWGGWRQEPFTSKSPTQISVYRPAES